MSGIKWIWGRSYKKAFVLIHANTPGTAYHIYLMDTATLRPPDNPGSSFSDKATDAAAPPQPHLHLDELIFHYFCRCIDPAARINKHTALQPFSRRIDGYGSSVCVCVSEPPFKNSRSTTRANGGNNRVSVIHRLAVRRTAHWIMEGLSQAVKGHIPPHNGASVCVCVCVCRRAAGMNVTPLSASVRLVNL